MKKNISTATQKTLSLLHAGKLEGVERYAGKHVYVAGDTVIPLQSGKRTKAQLSKLIKTYGRIPVITFVPRQGMSYILCLWERS
ncbi:MAG: hypothetical protein UW24_C0028G0006 [Parcubacteria group bacterium GW2011_GWA2_44_12]|nr:MAG: hypothetical protein UW24_C0028G0006 [Parcubacteria group bacterium GW2011_GWA2_44_12]